MTRAVTASIGVGEHGNSADLVTISAGGELVDRRRIDLTSGLPTHPYHHEGSWSVGRYLGAWSRPISLPEAVSLVESVRSAAEQGAVLHLAALAESLPVPVASIALRLCPALPASIEQCIRDTRAATVADSVMYRQALARAAEGRGWRIFWYERNHVMRGAAMALGVRDIDPLLRAMGRLAGPPWQARHKLAAAAAIAALAPVGPQTPPDTRTTDAVM